MEKYVVEKKVMYCNEQSESREGIMGENYYSACYGRVASCTGIRAHAVFVLATN